MASQLELLGIGALLGASLAGAALAALARRWRGQARIAEAALRARQATTVAKTEAAQATSELQHRNEQLEREVASLATDLRQAQATALQASAGAEAAQRAALLDLGQQLAELKDRVRGDCGVLAAEIDQLMGTAKTFDRWHDEVNVLLNHNQEMHGKNSEFTSIVNRVKVLSLNASIEAAKAGAQGKGFAVVAEGVGEMAAQTELLSNAYGLNIHKNDLITTATFQDLQAGGKMIRAAVTELKVVNDRIQARVAG